MWGRGGGGLGGRERWQFSEGQLAGCFGFNGPFEIVFQSISGRLPNAMRNAGQEKLVALLFYVHGKHLRSYRDGQLT